MRAFKTRRFSKYAKANGLSDAMLGEAWRRAERGLIDADLGGGVIKQRVGRVGGGRSGGFRILLAFRSAKRVVFLYGFAKNERDNIDRRELATLRDLAAAWLEASEPQIEQALVSGLLQELEHEI